MDPDALVADAADAAVESPEEVVAALEDEVERLRAREATLTADLDAVYNQTFGGLTVEVPLASPTMTTADGTPDGPEPEKLETKSSFGK